MRDTFVIEAHHLGKTFKSNDQTVVALRDLSLTVRAGELFGLFGHNGAGKSTLVRMLATLVRPTHGSATVNGFDLVSDEQRVRASIGLVTSDERSFYARLSGVDNLRFFGALQNVPRPQLHARVHDALELFGLGEIGARPFQTYSTGQRQRLNMARAILHNPPILFLDEPTKSMDVQTSDFVKALVKRTLVAQQGKTVVFISHELYEMENFCDRVAIIHHGELRALGTPAELMRQLPTQPAFEFFIEGNVEQALCALQQLDGDAAVSTLEQQDGWAKVLVSSRARADLGAWQTQLYQTITAQGGYVRAFQQVGGRSLRDVIRHFSADDVGS